MEPDSEPDDGIRKSRWWIIILGASLLALSFSWSIDSSFIYFTLSVALFSVFKILQLELSKQTSSREPQAQFEKSYESLKPSQTWLFWQDVKEIFRKDSAGPKTAQQSKIFVALVAGFIGLIFLITILAALLGGGSSEEDSTFLYQKATDFYNNQQYDSAAFYYGLVLKDDPENIELYVERGNAFLNANVPDSALIMYDNALTLQPQHTQAQYNKGLVYFNRKDYQRAIGETKKVLEYDPGYTNGMLLLGDCYYNQIQFDSAIQWYEGAYTTGYRSAILCHLMAYIYDTKGETNHAIKLYQEAIGQDSSIVDIYSRLGELLPGEEGNWYRQKAIQLK